MLSNALYAEVDLLAIFMIFVLIHNMQRFPAAGRQSQVLRLLMLSIVGVLGVDVCTCLANGGRFAGARALNIASEVLYYVFTGVLSCLWFLYAYHQVGDAHKWPRRVWAALLAPMLLLVAMAVGSIRFDLLFYVDAANWYHRGRWFWVQAVIAWGYLAGGSLLLVRQARRVQKKTHRNALYLLASFSLYPLVGSLLQIFLYGMPLVWPFSACALLLIFVDQRNRQIATDALTGVNNRGRMDQYLREQIGEEGVPLFLMLIDMDHFKEINDTYGHSEGDSALIYAADLLRRVLARTSDFLARYGGDEFVIIGRRQSEAEVQALIGQIRAELTRANAARPAEHPTVELSIGYALYSPGQTAEQLFAQADAAMYAKKNAAAQ